MKSFKNERKKKIKRQDQIVDNLISKAKSKSAPKTDTSNDSAFDKISAINSRSTINGINDNRKKKTEQRDRITPRALLCLVLVVVIFALFAVRLFDWQIVHGEEYKKLSVASTSYTVSSQATRGEIYDVKGRPMAINETTYQIVVNRLYLRDNRINDVIVSLIGIMRECNAAYIDELPISVSGEQYVFDEGSAGDVEYIESEAMLNREGLSAQEIIDGLAERYEINNINDPFLRRSVVSVRYNMEKRGFSYQQVYVFADEVDSDVVAVVSERMQTQPAVEIRTTNERVIKYGVVAPHILGVVGALNEEEYEELKDEGYALNDTIGKFGVEAGLEEYLRGEAGEKTITKDADGNIVSEKETVKAKPGDTVYLTIDSNVQAVTNYSLVQNVKDARAAGEQAVKEAKATNAKQQSLLGEDCVAGAAVMLDLRDFSVIAASSAPTYDITRFYDPDYSEYLFTDDTVPMFNRAFNGSFSPGSSFKPCTALAALQEGIITEDTIINCTGTYDYYKDGIVNCLHKHGEIDMTEAMAHSCNYYFAEVGRRIGITTMYLYAEKLGLGVKTGLEVNEDAGFLAGRDSTTWYEGNTVQAAIGQSDNTFTPIQLATYVATIANNGVRYRTHLVRKIVNYEQDETVLYNDPKKPEIVADAGVSKSNINKVKQSMREVLISGTAMDTAGKYPMEYAGKTGTAENAGSDHVTFVCFAPYKNPEVAIAVVLEHGAKSRYAQYVAMDMMDAYFNGKTLKDIQKKRWS